jgi:hydrogenase expression/formation protein HypE
VAFVPQAQAEKALEAIGEGAVQVGVVRADAKGKVTAQSRIGVSRVVDMLSGEQLPRIC